MSRLYRNTRTEALTDVIVSAERTVEIEKQYEGVHLPSYNAFGSDDKKRRNLYKNFIVFRGQGVHHPGFGDGVVMSEDQDGVFVTVRFKDEVVLLMRKLLQRIKYPNPHSISAVQKGEQRMAA
jgi:hypothetical protein